VVFTAGPRQLVLGNNNKINRLIGINADVVPNLNLANAIRGSGGVCIGNNVNSKCISIVYLTVAYTLVIT